MIDHCRLKGDFAQELLRSENKLAFIFPGVGPEYLGMGKYVFGNFPCAREVFEQTSAYANQDIVKLCFAPEESSINWYD